MSRKPAVIIDMDDTLCDVSEIRHLYAVQDDFRAFTVASRGCPPRSDVLEWCHRFHTDGHALLIVTGRSDEFRAITVEWLAAHLPVPYAGLWMRPRGHNGSNTTVKREIHVDLVRAFDIRAAIDDDPLIVQLWAELGISATLVPEVSALDPLRYLETSTTLPLIAQRSSAASAASNSPAVHQ